MATERLAPDAILELTNLTGTVSEIQDDPDSPDANWLDAASDNADSIVRVSFPSPSGNLTAGPDLQEFRVLMRKFGGTGTPTARIEIYESSGFLQASTDQNVAGETVRSIRWNANILADPSGAGVECRVYGTKTGGGPSARATVEVGAVEWNVAYDSGQTLKKIINETVGTTETNVRPLSLRRIISETLSISEGIVRSLITALVKVISETVAINEVIVRRLFTALTRVVNETVSTTEGILRRLGLKRIINETQFISESILRTMSLRRIVNETIGLVEGKLSPRNLVRLIAETVGVQEVITRLKAMKRVVNETVSLVEGIARLLLGAPLVKVINETVGIAESFRYWFDRILKVHTKVSISQDLNMMSTIRRGLRLKSTIMEK